MSCKAVIRESGNVAIVDLSGRITLGEGSGTVRNTIKDLIEKGKKDILLNLAEVSYIDSAGLGELIGSYASVTNLGGRIKLLNLQKRVQDLLQVTKLHTIFETYTEEAAAVNSFTPKSATV